MPVNPTSGVIPWNNAGTFDDSNLLRRNTSTTDQRYLVDGTISQIFRIYRTSDDGISTPTNYSRVVFDFDTTNEVFRLHTQAGGTGTQLPINIGQASGAIAVPVGINASPGSLTAGRALQIGRTQGSPTDEIDLYFEGVAAQTGDFIQANSPDAGGIVFRVLSNGGVQSGLASALDGVFTLFNDSNSNTTSIIPGTSPASSVSLRLPSDDPAAGEVLTVTSFAGGVAVLEWAAVVVSAGGSNTQLQRNNGGALGGVSGVTSDGTNITAGDGNLRAISPWISTGIDDSVGNRIIGLTATGSAVNYVNITNTATGSGPTIAAAGSDGDVQLNLTSKGDGNVVITSPTNDIRFSIDSSNLWMVKDGSGNATLRFGDDGKVCWTNDSGPGSGSVDTAIERNTAGGMLEVNNGTTGTFRDAKVRQYYADQTLTGGGTTGDQTIDKSMGSVNFAGAATSLTVTCNLCSTSSLVFCFILTNDATAVLKNVVPGSGSFVITMATAPTAETRVGFVVFNK